MTNNQLPVHGKKTFEELKLTNEHGAEYWSARDLQPLLGYTQWRRFEQAIERAMTSCEASGNSAEHHFAGAGKPITGGKGAVQVVDDYESMELFGLEEKFAFPKPEGLIHTLLEGCTNPGDLILDSFGGSGTTGAVAHKMNRRWIMVELGEHCHTHIIPRLKKVIDGEDPGGITKSVNWKGGGGFRYYRLAPSLLEKDKWGNWVINQTYNAAMLAEALCKLEDFTYAPSDSVYWQHGHSTERDFIYVTTANLNHEQLQQLNDEVAGYCPHPSPLPGGEGGYGATLLVLCTAFRGRGDYPNITVKKIPKQVLSRCEWGHDDYSLQVENLPQAPPKPGQQALFGEGDT